MVQNSPREPNLIKSSHLNVLEMKMTFFIKIAFQPFILNKYFSGEKSKDNLLKFFFFPQALIWSSVQGEAHLFPLLITACRQLFALSSVKPDKSASPSP